MFIWNESFITTLDFIVVSAHLDRAAALFENFIQVCKNCLLIPSSPLITKYIKRGDTLSGIKRTKMDDQMERMFEEFLTNLWQNKKQVFITLCVVLPVAILYMWREQRDFLDRYIPTDLIEETAIKYFPTIIILLFFLALLLGIRSYLVVSWNKKNYEYVAILPHEKDGVTVESLNEMIRTIHFSNRSPLTRLIKGKERFNFLIYYGKKGITFYMGAPTDRIDYLKTHLSSLYSKVEYYPADDLVFPSKKAVGGRLKIRRKRNESTLSLARYKTDKLPVIFNNMKKNTWIQISFSPNNGRKIQKDIETAQKEKKDQRDFRDRTYTDKEELRSWDNRMSGNQVAFDVTVSVATESYPGVPVLKSIGSAINSIMADVNELKYRRWRHSVNPYPTMYPYQMVWTGSELANLVHLPHLSADGIAEKYKDVVAHNTMGRELLRNEVFSNPEGVLFGYQYHPFVKDREVRIMLQYLGEHWGLAGLNGSGKSTLVNQILNSFHDNFVRKAIAAGYSFFDPAKETAMLMLNNLMVREVWEKQAAEREKREPNFQINWNKVKWISFKDTEHPPALGLLHKLEGESDDLATDQVFKVIRDEFQPAPQTERLMKMCIRTLLVDPGEKHSILGVRPLLFKPKFRDPIINRLRKTGKYPDIIDFWENEAEHMLDASAIALLTRLDIFSSNPTLRRIFGQKGFNFPIRKWMDEGYIILYDLSGMDETEIGLISSYLSYLYYRITDRRPTGSNLHQLIVDEAAKVKASIFPYMIREQRKFGLSLGVITQNLEDLSDELLAALTNVTGNLFVCRQGADNAKKAADAFKIDVNGQQRKVYSESYLQNLPKRVAAIKITDKVDGVEKAYQTVIEVPPMDRYLENGEVATFNNDELKEQSDSWTLEKAKELQSRDGLHYTEIDDEIYEYLYGRFIVKEDEKAAAALQEEETILSNVENHTNENETDHEDDLPLEVVKSEVSPPPDEQEDLQQALTQDLAKNVILSEKSEEIHEQKEQKKDEEEEEEESLFGSM